MIKVGNFIDLKGGNELEVTLHITGKHYTKLRKLAARLNEWPHIALVKILNGLFK